MMKYFKKSEHFDDEVILNSPDGKYHGASGKVHVSKETSRICEDYLKGFELAGAPVPLDNIGNASLGYARGLYTINKGIRSNSAFSYIAPIKDNPKLHISQHSLATKIIFDDHKNAIGVEFMKKGKKFLVKAKKEVILSAGPLKSPQLLMLSGIGREKVLKKWDLPCISNLPVGQNLQNVIAAFLVFKTNKQADPEPFNAHHYVSPLVVGYGSLNKSSNYPDHETLNFIIDDYYYFLSFCGYTLAFDMKLCDRLYSKANNTQLLATVLNNLNINSRGEILLRSSDPKDSPKVITGYYSNDEDLDAIADKIQYFMTIVSTRYFKDMGLEFMEPINKCGHLKRESREYWRCYALCMIAGTGRYVGTNSMGSVVDTKFCVYGVNKIRVVDASVIPNTLSGSPVAAILALAEKAAEIIMSDP